MTEALDHYLDQRDKDYERQGETMMSRQIDDERRYNSDLIAELSDEIATLQAEATVLKNQISLLKNENERMMKLAHSYITAFEKLAFEERQE